MPFVKPENEMFLTPDVAVGPEHDYSFQNPAPEGMGIIDSMKAAFRLEGSIGGLAVGVGDMVDQYVASSSYYSPSTNPNYTPFTDPQFEGYEANAYDFVNSRSPEETRVIKNRVDRFNEEKQRLAESGATGMVAQLAVGLVDPINFVPFGALSKTKTALTLARDFAAIGAASGTAEEGLLRWSQGSTRSDEESLMAIGSQALFMGAIGGVTPAVTKFFRGSGAADLGDALKENMLRAFRGEDPLDNGAGFSAAGAQAKYHTTMAQETPESSFGAGALADTETLVGTPGGRTIRSDSIETRRASQMLAENSEIMRGAKDGVGAELAAETQVKEWMGKLASAIERVDAEFMAHRGISGIAGKLRTGAADLTGMVPSGQFTHDQWSKEISDALRNGDKHANPHVQKAAMIFREDVIEPMKQAAIEVSLLDPDVKAIGSESYLTRIYAVEKIVARQHEFAAILRKHFLQERDKEVARDPAEIAALEALRDNAKNNIPIVEKLIADKKQLYEDSIATIEKALKRERLITPRRDAYRKNFDRLDRAAEYARNRADRLKPTGELADDDPLKVELDYARGVARGKIKEPPRLVNAIRLLGGIHDPKGLLKKAGLRSIDRKNGVILEEDPSGNHGIDKIGRELAGGGWLEARWNQEEKAFVDIETDDVIAALFKDLDHKNQLSDTPVYNEARDAQEVFDYKSAKQTIKEVVEAGGDFSMSNEELAFKLGALPEFKGSTPVTRTASRGADYHLKRMDALLEQSRRDLAKAEADLQEVNLKRSQHEMAARFLRDEINDAKKQRAASKRLFEKRDGQIENHKVMRSMPDNEFDGVIQDVIDNIVGNNGTGMWRPVSHAGRSLRERTLEIQDSAIKDFLEDDVFRILKIHTRQMAADIEISRRFGSPDMTDTITDIKDSYARLKNRAAADVAFSNPKLSGEKLEQAIERHNVRLDRGLKHDIRDIESMRDRLRGTRSLPKNPRGWMSRSMTFVRNFNLTRLGGGFGLASVPDMGSIAMTHGFLRMAGSQGFGGLVRGLRSVRLNMQETRWAGTGLDMILDTRAHAIGDIIEDYGQFSKLERGMAWAADKMSMLNGMTIWNSFAKQLTGAITISRTLQALEDTAAGTISKKEAHRLAQLGINHDTALELFGLVKKFGVKEDGVWSPNTHLWVRNGVAADDMRSIFRGSVTKDADRTVVTPGIADKPLWMDEPDSFVAAMGQFRSFFISSMTRVTTRGLQQRDANVAQGLVMMGLLGALSYYLKTPADKLSDDPLVWAKEGLDRSGAFGWFFEANNILEKASGNSYGLSAALGIKESQRYVSRGIASAIGGPSVGLVEELAGLLAAQGTDTWGEKDTDKALRLIPYWNLFYLRWLRDQIDSEEEVR